MNGASKIIEGRGLRLDLGCGLNKRSGFIGVDLYAPDADVKLDLLQFPYPWADGSVSEIVMSHVLEHVPQKLRWPLFEELWRLLENDGVIHVEVPNWKSERSYGDMTHEWPPVTAFAFNYLNQAWREANNLTYGPYALKCNFESRTELLGIPERFSRQENQARQFAVAHYLESYMDMAVMLVKKPMRMM